MRVLAAYQSSGRWISHNTYSMNGKNRRNTIYNRNSMSWSWVRHGVRPSAPFACASLGFFASAMSIGGHWPWDSVIVYRLFICEGLSLYIIINYYQMEQHLGRACSVYRLYIIINHYQRRVSQISTWGLSIVHYYRVLSNEIVSQQSRQCLSVVHYYQLLSEKSILVEYMGFVNCTLLSSIIK